MTYFKTGERIKELRQSHKMTQKILGERVGVTKGAISIYEAGDRYPSYDVLLRIAAVFHVSTDYLLGLEDTPKVSLEGLSEDNVRLVLELVEALRGK